MALSVYLDSGGQDDVGAGITTTQGVLNGVNALLGTQGNFGSNQGGWNYVEPEGDGDLSTTQFAMAGLSAAELVSPGSAATLPAAVGFVNNAKGGDGGHGYRSGGGFPSTSSMTASGVWTYRLAGQPVEDPQVQSALVWLQQNFRYQDHINPDFPQSYFYYLWAAAKAFEESLATRGENTEALLRAGKIYEEQLNQPKQALAFYVKYREVAKPGPNDPIHSTIQFLEQADTLQKQPKADEPPAEGEAPASAAPEAPASAAPEAPSAAAPTSAAPEAPPSAAPASAAPSP
jgi:hypothetical protein